MSSVSLPGSILRWVINYSSDFVFAQVYEARGRRAVAAASELLEYDKHWNERKPQAVSGGGVWGRCERLLQKTRAVCDVAMVGAWSLLRSGARSVVARQKSSVLRRRFPSSSNIASTMPLGVALARVAAARRGVQLTTWRVVRRHRQAWLRSHRQGSNRVAAGIQHAVRCLRRLRRSLRAVFKKVCFASSLSCEVQPASVRSPFVENREAKIGLTHPLLGAAFWKGVVWKPASLASAWYLCRTMWRGKPTSFSRYGVALWCLSMVSMSLHMPLCSCRCVSAAATFALMSEFRYAWVWSAAAFLLPSFPLTTADTRSHAQPFAPADQFAGEGTQGSEQQGFVLLADKASVACGIIEPQELTIAFDAGNALGDLGVQLSSKRVLELSTSGGGACAIHVAFGVVSHRGARVAHVEPRGLLADVLSKPLAQIQQEIRQCMHYIFDSVVSSLWDEFVTPYVQSGGRETQAPPEEAMFLRRLKNSDNERVWEAVRNQIEANHVAKHTRDKQKLDCKQASASVFRRDVEEMIWRRLGVQAGVLPGNVMDFLRYTQQELDVTLSQSSSREASDTEFLQPPWVLLDGQVVVKGSAPPVPFCTRDEWNPKSKYEALFDLRPDFGDLRIAFLETVAGPRMERVGDALAEGLGTLTSESISAITTFLVEHSQVVGITADIARRPERYAHAAWPLLAACMSDTQSHYFFSCNEFLLVCELCKRNVIIFGTRGASAEHVGSVVGHGAEPRVLVALHMGHEGRRVRSHFQRLVLQCDVLEMKRQNNEEAERRAREAKRMAIEDELSAVETARSKQETRQMECEDSLAQSIRESEAEAMQKAQAGDADVSSVQLTACPEALEHRFSSAISGRFLCQFWVDCGAQNH